MANGKDDSSTLCVIPVFDRITKSKESKDKFIRFLNERFGNKIKYPSDTWNVICYGKEGPTHRKESRFHAPTSRLIWLIDHLFGERRYLKTAASYKNELTRAKRTALFSGDKSTRDEAISALLSSNKKNRRAWMIFEGNTAPDVCIITDHFVLVIEAKQTEGERTTTTTWGTDRDQLIRHMDAFLDDPIRKVYGLFIYDENPKYNYDFDVYKSISIFSKSLVHRKNNNLIKKAKDGYLGAITWDELSRLFDVKIGHKQKERRALRH